MNGISKTVGTLLILVAATAANAQEREVPEPLQPWQSWVLWGDRHLDCPQPYYDAGQRLCSWPSELLLAVNKDAGTWSVKVAVFSETWLALPGSEEVWPLEVRVGGEPVTVVERNNRPSVKLPPGEHQLEGSFRWSEMPQRIAIPPRFGILALEVEGQEVPLPRWDSNGLVWLKRQRSEEAAKDLLAVQVYRVIEDGIPMWLRTEIELTVSGKSREEELGSVLPEGWKLSTVDSPIPVAVDSQGQMKAQVRAGKWTVALHAFRTEDLQTFRYDPSAEPIVAEELIGYRAKPGLRTAEFEDIQAIDVNQTTFPKKWRQLPVYAWDTAKEFKFVEKMRGMGTRRPEGVKIARHLWLDEDGAGFTYQDRVAGEMQQIWRLDVAEGQELGAVRIDGVGQLITTNPTTGESGVEIRDRKLDMVAVGRTQRVDDLPATGWQSSAESLNLTLTLPPGWRLFALFGADTVRGDWLTSWTLLDLFLTLIFALAVFKLWGFWAGLLALLAFGLSYHEPAAPRFTWFFLLIPLALLQVVTNERGRSWLNSWRNLALITLLLYLIPFLAQQVQSAIYPQLEPAGRSYGFRDPYPLAALDTGRSRHQLASPYHLADEVAKAPVIEDSFKAEVESRRDGYARRRVLQSDSSSSNYRYWGNMQLDLDARVQTGPAEPQWNWNQVNCYWNGPVAAGEVIKPIFITSNQRRLLTVVRIVLLLLLLAILLGVRIKAPPVRSKSVAMLFAWVVLFAVSSPAHGQLPDAQMLQTLRERLLEESDAFPRAAEIPAVELSIEGNRLKMTAEVHAQKQVAVPLPGRLPAWSPLSVRTSGAEQSLVQRLGGYLWIVVPEGVHEVTVEGLLPDAAEWDWTFHLKPRYVQVNAPGWNVTGISDDGVPEKQVFFARQQELGPDQAAYDQEQFAAVAQVQRQIETGLVWKVRNKVVRLSAPGKALSLKIPLLDGESVLSSRLKAENGVIEVRLGANQQEFAWESELSIVDEIKLQAPRSDQWVERWQLLTSPMWSVDLEGVEPTYEENQENLMPTWYPWPGEAATLSFSKPQAVAGDTITIKSVRHEITVGSRQRTAELAVNLECSLAKDFEISLPPEAEVSPPKVGGQAIPVRRVNDKLIVPTRPGRQTIEATWVISKPLEMTAEAGQLELSEEAANVTTILHVPGNRWVLWADGPLRGPAVRFWTVLAFALLLAIVLGSVPGSPLRRYEWILLALGLTQVHVFSAMLVVGWLFLLARRGRSDVKQLPGGQFNLLQIGIVFLTVVSLAIIVVVVGEGLLGNPDMFVLGNGSSRTFLQWFQPRTGTELPNPYFVSVSVWYYRLLMLLWALWLAVALLRWLKWGWQQFTKDEAWRTPTSGGKQKAFEAPP